MSFRDGSCRTNRKESNRQRWGPQRSTRRNHQESTQAKWVIRRYRTRAQIVLDIVDISHFRIFDGWFGLLAMSNMYINHQLSIDSPYTHSQSIRNLHQFSIVLIDNLSEHNLPKSTYTPPASRNQALISNQSTNTMYIFALLLLITCSMATPASAAQMITDKSGRQPPEDQVYRSN